MKNLTDRQSEILGFIKTSVKSNGYPPTRREIAAHFGFKSDNAAQDHLMALYMKGAIKIASNVSRGIKVL